MQIPDYNFQIVGNCFHPLADQPKSSGQILLHSHHSKSCHKREDYNKFVFFMDVTTCS
jgi:hypothetical protein